MDVRARVILEVHAGIIPGDPMDEYSKRWTLSTEEAKDPHALEDIQIQATNYSLELMNPNTFNWVVMEWIWL